MLEWEKYLDDPDLVDEPRALKEVHAIRLYLAEETKGLTDEQRRERSNAVVREVEERLGVKFKRPEPALVS